MIRPGVKLDTHSVTTRSKGAPVNNTWTDTDPAPRVAHDKRTTERQAVAVSARLTWKDARGATRFASAVARNVSEFGVYVECQPPVSIPLYRLVQLQLDRTGPEQGTLPAVLKQGRVLSAVYRVSPPSPSRPQGFALRMMVDPGHLVSVAQTRATA